MEKNLIEKAIKYLQSLDQKKTVIDHFDITYGATTEKLTSDQETFFERAPDGSFFLEIQGKVMKNQ